MITIIKPGYTILTPLDGIVEHIERCGRVCYKSEDRITEGSAERFVRNICRNRHESVLEHATITAMIVCSRACSHQLVRHRIATYSQESQRYCNYGKADSLKVICPPSIGLTPGNYNTGQGGSFGMEWVIEKNAQRFNRHPEQSRQDFLRQKRWIIQIERAYNEYKIELAEGIPPGDARYVLPNATKTELAVTLNLRMWRHVFEQRALNQHAQWEIRGIFSGILNELTTKLPSVFEDLIDA